MKALIIINNNQAALGSQGSKTPLTLLALWLNVSLNQQNLFLM